MFGWKRWRVERLTRKGYDLIRQEEYDEALKVAEKLDRFGYSASFEIAALAHAGRRDLDAAVSILETGVKAVPHVWLNWQLLGNYRSELERYDEAVEAYSRATQCPDAWLDSIKLNQAVLASRMKRYTDALQKLDQISDQALRFPTLAARLCALNGLKRHDEARQIGEQTLKETDDDADGEKLDALAYQTLRAMLALGEPKEAVKARALQMMVTYGPMNRVLSTIRDLDDVYSESARYFRLLVHGLLAPDDPLFGEAKGFYASVDVVADSVDEALDFISALEQHSLEDLGAEDVEDLEPRPDEPKGVYRIAGYALYASD